jgi:hypothetical protein
MFLLLTLSAASLIFIPLDASAQETAIPFECEQISMPSDAQVAANGCDEYAVLDTALTAHDPHQWWQIDSSTYPQQLSAATVQFLNNPGMPDVPGLALDDVMVSDFNGKNSKSHRLSLKLIGAKNTNMYRSSGGTRTIKLSRPGFDIHGTRAVVFLRDTFISHPEAFTQEDFFMLLENSGDDWKVIRKIKAGFKHS